MGHLLRLCRCGPSRHQFALEPGPRHVFSRRHPARIYDVLLHPAGDGGTKVCFSTFISGFPTHFRFSHPFPVSFRLARKLLQSLWIATTTATLFLFGVCTFLEGQTEPFAAKLGAGIYVFTIVWSHTGLYQDGTDPKTGGNNLFTAYVAISGVVYTTTAFFLAFHPSFAPWRLALPIASVVGLLGWLSFFSGHFQGSWPATVLLVFVTCLPVFLYGFTLGDLEKTSYSDNTETDLALAGLVVLFVTFPVAHWWIGDKHDPDGKAGGVVATTAPVGSLLF